MYMFCSEVENIFLGPYAAMKEKQKATLAINWKHYDGCELVNVWEMAARYTAKVMPYRMNP